MSAGQRKCACCRHMYALDETGTFREHKRSRTIMGDQRRCPGSRRTPKSAAVIAIAHADARAKRREART